MITDFFKTRIRNKIAVLPVSAVLLMSTLSIIYFPSNKKQELMSVLSEQVTATTDLLAFGLGVALDSDRFDAIGEGFNVAKGVGNVSYILIYDNNNKFLSAYNPDSIKISETRTEFASKPVKAGKYFEKASQIKFGKQSYGTVVVGMSLSTIDSNVRSSFLVFLVIGAGLSLLSLLISLIFSSKIMKPLLAVQEVMKSLAQNDLTKQCKVDTIDETAVMAESANTAISSLSKSLTVASNGADRISNAIGTLLSVSKNMSSNSTTMAEKFQTVSKTITDAKQNITTMKNSSTEVNSSILTLASSIEEMNASLNEVSKNCNNESQIASSASAKAGDAQNVMQALGDAAKEITAINDVINRIAQQTKLLALNATIEAASAGEAGKGFAVVAQEVKTLAQQTAGASSEIAKQIESIQQRTGNAISSITEIASVIEEINSISHSIVAAIEQQSATLNGIAEVSSKTSANSEKIFSDIAKWTDQMDNISQSFNAVDAAASESAHGAESIEHSVVELQQLSKELSDTVSQFKL